MYIKLKIINVLLFRYLRILNIHIVILFTNKEFPIYLPTLQKQIIPTNKQSSSIETFANIFYTNVIFSLVE